MPKLSALLSCWGHASWKVLRGAAQQSEALAKMPATHPGCRNDFDSAEDQKSRHPVGIASLAFLFALPPVGCSGFDFHPYFRSNAASRFGGWASRCANQTVAATAAGTAIAAAARRPSAAMSQPSIPAAERPRWEIAMLAILAQ